MLHLGVCLAFLHFVKRSEFIAVAYCHANISEKLTKVGKVVQVNLYYTLKLFL